MEIRGKYPILELLELCIFVYLSNETLKLTFSAPSSYLIAVENFEFQDEKVTNIF